MQCDFFFIELYIYWNIYRKYLLKWNIDKSNLLFINYLFRFIEYNNITDKSF